MLGEELDDDYFKLIEEHLQELKFKSGMLLSAQLGDGNKGGDYMLRRPREQGLLGRLFDRSGYSFTVPERDEAACGRSARLEDKGVNLVANALAQSVDHVRSFFVMIRGRARLLRRLCSTSTSDSPRKATDGVSQPRRPRRGERFRREDLYDVCLDPDHRASAWSATM